MRYHLRTPSALAILVAVLALTAVTTSTAVASPPEFTETTYPNKFTATSATSVVRAGVNVLTCTKGTATGEVTGTDTVANLISTYANCSGREGTENCAVHSPGLTNAIVTNTLKGELGTVKLAEAASLVGLLLEPGTGATYTTVEGTCLSPTSTKVTGKIAGEVTPINKKQLLSGERFFASGTGNRIQEIDVLGKGFARVPELEAFGAEVSYESTGDIQFARELKVT